MQCSGLKCAKYTLYAVNFLIIILACVTLGVGIWLSSEVSSFMTAINPELDPSGTAIIPVRDMISGGSAKVQTIANILITAGVFALVIGFLGFWAVYRASKSLIITYGVVMILVVLLELGAGIAFAVEKPKIKSGMARDFGRALDNYDYVKTAGDLSNHIVVVADQTYNNVTATDTALMNMLQVWIGCCGGISGYTDFRNSPYWEKSLRTVPVYCCKMKDTKTLQVADPACLNYASARNEENSWMSTGCAVKGTALLKKSFPSVIGVSVGIGLIDILGIAFAFYYHRCLTQEYGQMA